MFKPIHASTELKKAVKFYLGISPRAKWTFSVYGDHTKITYDGVDYIISKDEVMSMDDLTWAVVNEQT